MEPRRVGYLPWGGQATLPLVSEPLEPTAGALDRAAHLRTQPAELEKLRKGAGYLPVWRHRNLVRSSGSPVPVVLDDREAAPLREVADDEVFLGLVDGRALFAMTLPGHDEVLSESVLAEAGTFNDLRGVGPLLEGRSVDVLASARGLLYWHRHHGYCGSCGGETRSGEAGYVRICRECDRRHFPRTDPAIMALIEHEGRILLARQPRFPPQMFSILAGFVEPGESLEQAVHREVLEESGLEVEKVRYVRSQSWPFPSSLMLGFAMTAKNDAYELDGEELEEARWVSRKALDDPQGFFYPPKFSLSGQLIRMFMRGEV